ncbi:uncharacterized protein LOC144709671 [Wolffia australiana]
MGSCVSTCDVTVIGGAAGPVPPSAKVIGLGGELREYTEAVSAAEALAAESTRCFLCSSDKLFCNNYIPAVDPEERLEMGQIYYILAVDKLRETLTAAEMTAMAKKAIAALAKAAEKDGRRRTIRVAAATESTWGEEEVNGFLAPVKGDRRPPPLPAVQRKMKRAGSMKKMKASPGAYRNRSAVARFSSIPEFGSE